MKNFDATSKKSSWPYPIGHRLLHSPSLVAVGLSVGYETWLPIGWHHTFVIGWSKDELGLLSAPLHYGLTWPVGIPTVFQTPVTVPLHCNCLLLGLYKGTVKQSTVVSHERLLHNSLTDNMQSFFLRCLPTQLNQTKKMSTHYNWSYFTSQKLQNSAKQWNPKPFLHII